MEAQPTPLSSQEAEPHSGETPSPKAVPAHTKKILTLAFASTIAMTCGVSSIMPILPMLAEKFGISLTKVSLLITVFTLPGIVFSPLAGILADRYGRKVVLVVSQTLFCLAGAACAFAPDFNTLVALRFVQGIGAAPLGVLNNTILADTFSGRDLNRMIGYNMSVLSVCTAVFPTLGGLLALIHWRLSFLLPLITMPALFVVFRTPLLKPDTVTTLSRYFADLRQAVQRPRINTLLFMTFITFIMLYGPIITCFPALAHNKFGASPGAIGSITLLSSTGAAIMASQLGRLSEKFSLPGMLLCSQIFYVAALFLLPNMPTLSWVLLPIFLFGLGQGLNVPNIHTQLLREAPLAQRASIMAINGMLLRLGQTIAPLIFSVMIEWQGLDSAFYFGIVFALALALLSRLRLS